MIHLTDLHFKGIDSKFVNIAKEINSLNPDIIFFTGDSLESKHILKILMNF
jgi:predicted MPP superfamily phosphohydrolase